MGYIERVGRLINNFEDALNDANKDLTQENANTDGNSPTGIMGIFASESGKFYAESLLDENVLESFNEGYIHIHDFDYYATGTTTCVQLPLEKLLKGGFSVGNCYMREPKDILSAGALSSIAIQSNQNNQHGGQSYPTFDYDLAPYVEKTYYKHIKDLRLLLGEERDNIEALALARTIDDTYQSMEAFVHNANSMLCRNGQQVPFISVNFGTDTSKWGRIVSEQLMLAVQSGLGDGSTPIFPILVFKVKEGINFSPEDPNYDLYKLALETTSKRLFPNFVFLDAPFNLEHYRKGDKYSEIATMGCRTRVLSDVTTNIHTPIGRGNLSFTTLNLPMIAYGSSNTIDFFNKLDIYMDLAITQLYQRFEYQKNRKAGSFKFLYGQGVWNGGDTLKPDDKIGDVLNTGSLSVGFVGLAECLITLTGKHHGESAKSQELGLKIVKAMRDRVDAEAKKSKLNFSLLATPSESYCGKAVKKFRAKYGEVYRVSDRDYFTNSYHIPVWHNISAFEKIRLEAPYHELTNAGHITYVELDGDASKNIKALDQIVRHMAECGIGYGSINHPVDRCRECGTKALIDNECPTCGESENIERIRRITGYLVGSTERWNTAKLSELKDRVRHH